MSNAKGRWRSIREQAAVLRTLVKELERETNAADYAHGVHAQAIEESARLVAEMRRCATGKVSASPIARGSAEETSKRRVLVVEDDASARKALCAWLSPEYDVLVAQDGVEGLRLAESVPFDAIVTDVSMPRMNGIEMVDRIRALRPEGHVPILFLTGHTEPEEMTAGFSAGAFSYLVKPVDFELLDHELHTALTMRTRAPSSTDG